MIQLTPEGQQLVDHLAQRYQLSPAAVTTMLVAVHQGQGTMAQFNHPELGGLGQWMLNGMSMIGDMFNQNLKTTVDHLGQDLAKAFASGAILIAPSESSGNAHTDSTRSSSSSKAWWPSELGHPSSSGAQNQTRYAWFPTTARLAIEQNGKLTVYDTKDHQISGVSQQQDGAETSLTFTSQHGRVKVDSLPLVKTVN